MKRWTLWGPAALLIPGAMAATLGVQAQRTMPLRAPLAETVPDTIAGYASRNIVISDEELRVAGVTDYLARAYLDPDTSKGAAFTIYVGYYEKQTQGKTIHSPRNCLPGSGWEPLANEPQVVETPNGPVTVNRYLLQRRQEQALVLYWYQGRGRVAYSEYGVKWDLLRDAAVSRRSEEALARIVVPINLTQEAARVLAVRVATILTPSIFNALPE
jgi:EpsI family protein